MKLVLLVSVFLCSVAVSAQAPPSTVPEQLDAMKQCGFLVGEWKGDGWMMMGPGDRRSFSQAEKVQSKLNGLVLQIDGLGKDPSGKIVHEALATVAYEPHSKEFRFRSYEMQGHYLDTDSTCQNDTLVWNMSAGPRKIRYTIKLNDKRQWFEIGEMSADGTTWQKFFEMTLDKSK